VIRRKKSVLPQKEKSHEVLNARMSMHLDPEAAAHRVRVTGTGRWLEWQHSAYVILVVPDRRGQGIEWDE
jgi:hypothetical protein